MVSILFFILVTGVAFYTAFKNFKNIYDHIQLGKDEAPRTHAALRWKNVVLIAFGQKKMFANPVPAILHLFIYVAFLFTQLELLEILVDGLFHTHRIFSHALGGFYTFLISLIEFLSVGAFIATIAFLWRRNVLKLKRFRSAEMTSWPRTDANLILCLEIILILAIMTMNGSEQVLLQRHQDVNQHPFLISRWLGPLFFHSKTDASLLFLSNAGWWIHYLVVLAFLNYLPFSKHLHVVLAFFHTYYAKLSPRGEMENIPVITHEVKSMLGLETTNVSHQTEVPEFGVKDIFDLPKRILLSAYSCTECGRCTSECPANITGKKLSPRKIMMDIRDRCEEIGHQIKSGKQPLKEYNDGKSLFDYITSEEIHACTTCQACVEACPVLINPMEVILELRRNEILSQSKGPANWTAMFNSLENNNCVWPMSESRMSWTH